MEERADITELLRELSQGRPQALDRLVPIAYERLRAIAHAQLRRERPDHTLNTTALVNEAYLKLVNVRLVDWRDRAHFFAVAARLMRRILIDHARAQNRDKRRGHAVHVTLTDQLDIPILTATDELLALDEALGRLEAQSERQCRVVECHCFAGMSLDETAAALGISAATVKRDWAFARAWLNRELAYSDSDAPAGDLRPTP
jgi:RNA polymerase sigma-70 factor (ECF subfamily)